MDRVILIVLDSVGVGALPDAPDYGDSGCNTLVHTAQSVGGLTLPNLERFGLAQIIGVPGLEPVINPAAAYGKMAEKSAGKDTITGHWEIAGIILKHPFPTYPKGFPPEIIKSFEKKIGKRVLGNAAASGTEIIHELGEEHMRTGFPIVYTSADSVFQIAAHEEVIPLPQLYEICRQARLLLKGEYAVGRVIARPFIGQPGKFKRTDNRKDYSLEPPGTTLLDLISGAGMQVVGIGKINDIFAGRGVTESFVTHNNMDGIDKTLEALEQNSRGLIFANYVDFDMRFGHRNDPQGYARALAEFDLKIPEIIERLRPNDVLVITGDHGCDPVCPGTDHTREYVPVLIYGEPVQVQDLGIRETFADLGATIADMLGVSPTAAGTSFASKLIF